MTEFNEDKIALRLKELQAAYAKELPGILKRIKLHFGKVVASKAQDREALSEVYRLVHSISGSGPSFGFYFLGEMAHEMEILMDQVLKDPTCWDKDVSTRAAGVLRIMMQIPLNAEEHGQQTPDLSNFIPEPVTGRHKKATLWLGSDQKRFETYRTWLSLFGLRLKFHSIQNGIGKLDLQDLAAVILEDQGPDRFENDLKNIAEIRNTRKRTPLFFVSQKALNVQASIRAFEAGSDVCLVLPSEFFQLIARLDDLIAPETGGAYRLLIVEDDLALAENTATILRKAGLEVEILNQPELVESALSRFDPELILMDLYLGSCSGNAIAKWVRQRAGYRNLPIVYISRETELNKRIEAFEVGADDFLVKPVKYHYLYFSLLSRLKRSRLLRANLERDSLTGLLDHSEIRKKLAEAITTAKAEGLKLTFALVDLDHIGEVNSVLGSNGGDRVLQTLAKMLDMNVREKGWAGRYGGKEFSLILPNMESGAAEAFLDSMRQGFEQLIHGIQPGFEGIKSSFSAGLVTMEGHEPAAKFAGMALRALRSAQMQGGNQVVATTLAAELKPAPAWPHSPPSQTPVIAFEDEDEFIIFEEDEEAPHEEVQYNRVEEIPSKKTSKPEEEMPKIVIVDDEKKILDWLETQLGQLGYQVWTALSAEAGLKLVKRHIPEFLLTDLLLFPGDHGFELCKQVTQDPTLNSKVKVVVMTAVYRDDRYRREAMGAGAKAFLTKPLDLSELMTALNSLNEEVD